VTATMTYVGLDVHARSTHAAAIDVASGELLRARVGGGSEEVIGWLKIVTVPSASVEAARHLCRAREQVRSDLMRCRHRVSKLLLLHGRVYPEPSTWTRRHRQWLARQQFDEPATELAYLDTLAAVDGLVGRKAAIDERLSRLALEDAWWPTVARLRCFRGIDTLTALVLCREIGDFARFESPRKLSSWLGLVPALDQSGESRRQGAITKTGSSYARRLLVEAAWHYLRQPRIGATVANRQQGQPAHVLQIAWRAPSTGCTASTPACAHTQAAQRRHRRRRPRTRLLYLGRRRDRVIPHHSRLLGRAPGRMLPARGIELWAARTGHARS
jgi:transposase